MITLDVRIWIVALAVMILGCFTFLSLLMSKDRGNSWGKKVIVMAAFSFVAGTFGLARDPVGYLVLIGVALIPTIGDKD